MQPTKIMAKGRGKTFFRSVEACKKRVRDNDEYFIKRHGGWFRPGAHGYTNELSEAGKFNATEARGYLSAEGVSVIPVGSAVALVAKEAREHIKAASRLFHLIENY